MSQTKIYTCLFLGSGFSKALFNIPIQADFVKKFLDWSHQADRHPYISPDLQEMLTQLDDIELVFSLFFELSISTSEPEEKINYIRDMMLLRTAITIYLSGQVNSDSVAQATKLMRRYLKRNNISEKDLFIVTTNYDLAAELILENIFGARSYRYVGDATPAANPSTIPVAKLHGSINWMENRGPFNDSTFYRRKEMEILNPNDLEACPAGWHHSGYFYKVKNDKYTPILVPFLFQKNEIMYENNKKWNLLFSNIKAETYDFLCRARKIHFWGYGLPAADFHMFSFLYGIIKNHDIDIEIVDPSCHDTNLIKLSKLIPAERVMLHRLGLNEYMEREL